MFLFFVVIVVVIVNIVQQNNPTLNYGIYAENGGGQQFTIDKTYGHIRVNSGNGLNPQKTASSPIILNVKAFAVEDGSRTSRQMIQAYTQVSTNKFSHSIFYNSTILQFGLQIIQLISMLTMTHNP